MGSLRSTFFRAVIGTLFLVTLSLSPKSAEASLTPFKTSGAISGTGLTYERLVISKKGNASVMISNSGNRGESFIVTFSFFTDKNVYLTGFTIEGFVGGRASTSYRTEIDKYRLLERASYMRILGRAGRSSEDV